MDDGGLWLFDEETGEPILRLIADSDDVWRAAFSDSRRRVATANGRYYARIWDGESGCELTRLRAYFSSPVARHVINPQARCSMAM